MIPNNSGIRICFTELEKGILQIYEHFLTQRHLLKTIIKSDNTLLTQVDLEIQEYVVRTLTRIYPMVPIISEEQPSGNTAPFKTNVVWVLDPLDGTSEFTTPNHKEFCTALALIVEGVPTAGFLIAPVLGVKCTPLVFRAFVSPPLLEINGVECKPSPTRWPPLSISATRSISAPPRSFESLLQREGLAIKTRTTSQSLDMIRTAMDLQGIADINYVHRFDLFFREKQKLWDSATGLVFASAAGLKAISKWGAPISPITPELLSTPLPTLETVVVGNIRSVEWFQQILKDQK